MALKRMWINQPSWLQPLHKMHGIRVLAEPEPNQPNTMRAWLLEGEWQSISIPKQSLSDGWPSSSRPGPYVVGGVCHAHA